MLWIKANYRLARGSGSPDKTVALFTQKRESAAQPRCLCGVFTDPPALTGSVQTVNITDPSSAKTTRATVAGYAAGVAADASDVAAMDDAVALSTTTGCNAGTVC